MDSADAFPARKGALPGWFTPARLLAIFCTTNLVVYLDRGVIASNGVNGSPRTELLPQGSGIQGDFNLSNFQDGLLATAFLVGLLAASPVFSEACKHHSAFRLIGVGMATWVVANLGCGLAWGFGSLIACRMLVGVGEASFVALAAPFIDDYAPEAQKARWFAAFYLCIPVGFAAGYVYGGLVAAALGWRAAFIIESMAMVPFVIFAFVSKPIHLAGMHDTDPTAPRSMGQVMTELGGDVATLGRHPVWVTNVGAYILYTAVLGVYAFWGPKAGSRVYAMEGESADLLFGAVTVVTGSLGSIGGGVALDKLGASLRTANLLCGAATLTGGVLMLAAFLATPSFGAFLAVFAAGQLALFCTQAPGGAIGMWSVPPALRPLAISLTTVCIHVFGDVPSPPLVGWLETALERGKDPAAAAQQWRYSMSIISTLLLASGGVWLWGGRLATTGADYRVLAAEAQAVEDESDGEEGSGGAADAQLPAGDAAITADYDGAAVAAALQQRHRGSHSHSGGGQAGSDKEPLLESGAATSSNQQGSNWDL